MKKFIKIGVSGDRGSFSEMAALYYIKKNKLNARFSYLIDMEGALSALSKQLVDLAIFPVSNSTGGLVKGAFEAMGRYSFKLLHEIKLKVIHSLMVLPGQAASDVKKIYSYDQALIQCEKYLRRNFPKTPTVYWHDTAKAARDLSLGRFGAKAAVIAPLSAAKLYGLKVLRKNIQDSKRNLTTFIVVKR